MRTVLAACPAAALAVVVGVATQHQVLQQFSRITTSGQHVVLADSDTDVADDDSDDADGDWAQQQEDEQQEVEEQQQFEQGQPQALMDEQQAGQ